MIRFLTIFIFSNFLILNTAFAKNISLNSLVNFSKLNNFKDNRKSVKKNKEYSAYKGRDPWILIQAYKGSDNFKQVALLCDQCTSKTLSKEHVKDCVQNFNLLYEHLAGEKYPNNLEEILNTPSPKINDLINDKITKFKLRLSSGALKCDGRGGERLRIDFFVSK